jgi:HSP20 family protein
MFTSSNALLLVHGKEQVHRREELAPLGWLQRWGRSSSNRSPKAQECIAPRVNVIDHDNEIVVRAEIPGVTKEDLDISVTEYAVTIRCRIQHEEKNGQEDSYCYDLANGAFVRTVGLLSSVDPQKARAVFDDGVLQVTIPIRSKIQRRHITFA